MNLLHKRLRWYDPDTQEHIEKNEMFMESLKGGGENETFIFNPTGIFFFMSCSVRGGVSDLSEYENYPVPI